MLTFQHIGTARHRGDENTMDVMLYGRQADGTSTAVRVVGIDAYGFLKADVSNQNRQKNVYNGPMAHFDATL